MRRFIDRLRGVLPGETKNRLEAEDDDGMLALDWEKGQGP